jgi:hypothetical protein
MYSREELAAAFEDYKSRRDSASQTGDWNVWAECFALDAHYIEHAYGELHGREAIRNWICEVMAPYPTMTFPVNWVVIDEENHAIVWEVMNAFPAPFDDHGKPFAFPNWSRLVYAGNMLWASEEDIYNPARDAGRVFSQWIAAGGAPLSKEAIEMKYR